MIAMTTSSSIRVNPDRLVALEDLIVVTLRIDGPPELERTRKNERQKIICTGNHQKTAAINGNMVASERRRLKEKTTEFYGLINRSWKSTKFVDRFVDLFPGSHLFNSSIQ